MGRGSVSLATIACLALLSCEPGDAERGRQGAGDPASIARGRALYAKHCAICHGERGDGRGPRRRSLSRPPADFRSPLFEPDPARIRRSIRDGIAGSDMPGWHQLDEQAIDDLVHYVIFLADESR
jgi:mono/diheme cytochrome c family protein